MNILNRSLLDYFLVFLIAIFLFWPLPPLEKIEEKPNKLAEKSAPSDHFFLQHSFPDAQPDIKAYTNALKTAHNELLNKSNGLPGFDHPWDLRGPGDAGGRVNAIVVHPSNDNIMLAGYSAGGIFKTIDGGTTWYPVFDDQPYLAIGDLIFDPNDPNTVYAGTGDPNITSYPFIGLGVYRSNDLGESWTQIGLEEEGIISRIAIDPTDSDIIYAGAMGIPFAKSTKRGLYKTTDGGANWTQVLFLSDSTGVADVLINPDNPQVIYAAGWDRIRNNSQSIISGNGARVHKSTDGGKTWTMLGGGLPQERLSRVGLAMSGSNSDHVFALYVGLDFNVHGLYKTTDAGNNWSEIPTDQSTGLFTNALGGFGWYFGQIRVDPNNDNRLFILGVQLWASNNGGNSWFIFSQVGGGAIPHVDQHDLVFNNSGAIILGNDGGMYKMEPGTNTWTDIEDIPATQFYRIAYNPHNPDAFYGGTQDNGTQMGLRSDAKDWDRIFGGDGFQVAFHPTNPDVFYVETQNGDIWATTNGGVGFSYGSTGLNPGEPKSWDMQYIISPHNPDILYTGTDRLYISDNGAIPNWVPITGNLAAPDGITLPRYHLISTLSESPMDSALIYVGTSDAKVRRRNPDGTVNDISVGLPTRYVTDVVASPDQPNVVFVSHSGYKDGEFIPHLHRSDDRGNNWINISGDLPPLGVNDLFIMPNYAGQVIFAGTDGGLYATLDGGSHWERLGLGMPMVPVYDIAYNDVYNELVVGTHARSIYSFPLDSIGVSNMPLQVSISGNIRKESGEGINNVDLGGLASTGTDGNYALQTFPVNCPISPEKDANIRVGLSVIDMVMIQRHLLFVDTLDSPYKIIAADVNNDNGMSIIDIVYIQRALLFIDSAFINNTSWRFVDAAYTFNNPLIPLIEDFPESYDCNGVVGSVSGTDFIGIKVGDVNGDVSPGFQSDPNSELLQSSLDLSYEDQFFTAGEVVDIPVQMNLDKPLLGLQMELAFDPAVLELVEVKSGSPTQNLPGELASNEHQKGLVAVVWTAGSEVLENGNQDFVTLKFKTKSKGKISDFLALNNDFSAEAVLEEYGNMQLKEVQLNAFLSTGLSALTPSDADVVKAFPNPFTDETQILIQLPEYDARETLTLNVFQLDGKRLLSIPVTLNAGENTYTLDGQLLPQKGLYYLSIDGTGKRRSIPLIYD